MHLGISASHWCLRSASTASRPPESSASIPAPSVHQLHRDPAEQPPASLRWLLVSLLAPMPCLASLGRREGCGHISLTPSSLASWSQTLHWASISAFQRSAEVCVQAKPPGHPPCHAEESPPIGQVSARPLTPASPLSAHPAGAGTEWHLWRAPAEGPGPKLWHPLPPPAASPGGPATVGDC